MSGAKRGINDKFIEELKNSGLIDLYKEHEKELFLAIRNQYINLYYNCASVCKVEYHPRKPEKIYCYVHKKYLGEKSDKRVLKNSEEEKNYREKTVKFVIDNYKTIINNINEVYTPLSHQEKYAQQRLVKNNNLNKNSEWYCIDIEYIKQSEKNKKDDKKNSEKKEAKFGRWDIIAISRKKDKYGKYRVALIELKCTERAIAGNSGIVKHASDYIKFIDGGKYTTYKNHLKTEIKNIVNNMNQLQILDLKIDDESEIADKPEFYFITLENQRDGLLKIMRRYIFKDEPYCSTKTVESEEKIDITKKNNKGFTPTFLFSDQEYNEVNIDDILDENQYENKGLDIRRENINKKGKTTIIVHRGTHQIGGCVTEIRSKDGTQIAIDIGENLPSTEEKLPKLDVNGLTQKSGTKKFNAVFVTHYHGDHIGLYNKVIDGIPIYIGKHSKEIYRILKEKQIIKDEQIMLYGNKYKQAFLRRKQREQLKDLECIKKFETYKSNPITKGKIKVTPIESDHSAFDSHMLLIEVDGKKILHTGDFRLHGIGGEKLLNNLKNIGKIDCLICEGTTLSRKYEKPRTENDLEKDAKKLFKQDKKCFVFCSSTNIDRIAVLFKAAYEEGRIFVCDEYQKELLKYISKIATEENMEKIYQFDCNKIKVFDKADDKLIQSMNKNGFVWLVRANKYFKEDMKKFPDATFIYSMWEGYLDKERTVHKKIQDFVPKNKKMLHTSGHADYEAIKQVIKLLKPKIIIPIHGETPEVFETMGLENCKIILLQDKVEYYL